MLQIIKRLVCKSILHSRDHLVLVRVSTRWLMQAEAFIAAHLEEAGVSKDGNDWLQGVDWSALSVTRSAAASLWSKEANHEE